jgi:uncharacterized peroxidase-related enzyme
VPSPFDVAEGDPRLAGALVDVDALTGQATAIRRVMLDEKGLASLGGEAQPTCPGSAAPPRQASSYNASVDDPLTADKEAAMPLVPPLTNDQASPQAQELFRAIEAQFKMVPNIFRAMGHAPAVLQPTLALNAAIGHDLDPKLRELAYLKASQVTQCGYCTHYHKFGAKKVGLSESQIADIDRYDTSSAYSELEKHVLRFAEQWASRSKVDADVVTALARGLSPTQLVTLAATCALAGWTNRFNNTFGMELP